MKLLQIWLYSSFASQVGAHLNDVNRFGLVATGPNDKVCLIDVLLLFVSCLRPDQPDSVLSSLHDAPVQFLGVSSESCEGVEVAIVVAKGRLVKASVTVVDGVLDFLVKHFHFVLVENDDLISVLIEVEWL